MIDASHRYRSGGVRGPADHQAPHDAGERLPFLLYQHYPRTCKFVRRAVGALLLWWYLPSIGFFLTDRWM